MSRDGGILGAAVYATGKGFKAFGSGNLKNVTHSSIFDSGNFSPNRGNPIVGRAISGENSDVEVLFHSKYCVEMGAHRAGFFGCAISYNIRENQFPNAQLLQNFLEKLTRTILFLEQSLIKDEYIKRDITRNDLINSFGEEQFGNTASYKPIKRFNDIAKYCSIQHRAGSLIPLTEQVQAFFHFGKTVRSDIVISERQIVDWITNRSNIIVTEADYQEALKFSSYQQIFRKDLMEQRRSTQSPGQKYNINEIRIKRKKALERINTLELKVSKYNRILSKFKSDQDIVAGRKRRRAQIQGNESVAEKRNFSANDGWYGEQSQPIFGFRERFLSAIEFGKSNIDQKPNNPILLISFIILILSVVLIVMLHLLYTPTTELPY